MMGLVQDNTSPIQLGIEYRTQAFLLIIVVVGIDRKVDRASAFAVWCKEETLACNLCRLGTCSDTTLLPCRCLLDFCSSARKDDDFFFFFFFFSHDYFSFEDTQDSRRLAEDGKRIDGRIPPGDPGIPDRTPRSTKAYSAYLLYSLSFLFHHDTFMKRRRREGDDKGTKKKRRCCHGN